MTRTALAITLLALALTVALATYALPPSSPAEAGPPVAGVLPHDDVSGVEVGIPEAAHMACSRLRAQANDDYWTTSKNTSITASPLANDPDNELQNFGGIASGPSHGTAEQVGLDAVKYTPDTNYVGSDSFTYIHVGCLQCVGSGPGAWCAEPDDDIGTVFITITN